MIAKVQKPNIVLREDGRQYLEGDWPDHIVFTRDFTESASPEFVTILPADEILITLANASAVYEYVRATDGELVEARLKSWNHR